MNKILTFCLILLTSSVVGAMDSVKTRINKKVARQELVKAHEQAAKQLHEKSRDASRRSNRALWGTLPCAVAFCCAAGKEGLGWIASIGGVCAIFTSIITLSTHIDATDWKARAQHVEKRRISKRELRDYIYARRSTSDKRQWSEQDVINFVIDHSSILLHLRNKYVPFAGKRHFKE